MIIELENHKFDIDIEKTKNYYTNHSLCDCVGCRNFSAQAKEKYPLLSSFLEKFGVEISKPDEAAWIDAEDNKIEYLTVYYTVNGKILSADKKDIALNGLTVKVNKDYAPNEQKDTDYFVLSVYGVWLPNITANQ